MNKIVKIILFVVLVFFLYKLITFPNSLSSQKKETVKTINVYSKIQSIPQDKSEYKKYIQNQDTNALDLLKKTNTVKTQGEGTDAFVTEINGIKADSVKKEFWGFYINDKPAEVGAGSYKLKNNDKMLWKIEKY